MSIAHEKAKDILSDKISFNKPTELKDLVKELKGELEFGLARKTISIQPGQILPDNTLFYFETYIIDYY